jgi:hypothetical protein
MFFTGVPQPVAGYPSMPQARPFSIRTGPVAASTLAPVAFASVTTQVPVAGGGATPVPESAAVPGSTTRATRFLPVSAGVAPQIVSKSPAARGTRGLAPPTAYRQPSTEPSAGTTWSAPFCANAHWPLAHW